MDDNWGHPHFMETTKISQGQPPDRSGGPSLVEAPSEALGPPRSPPPPPADLWM